MADVLDHLCAAAMEPIEQLDPEVLRDVVDTCRDLIDRAEQALRDWR